MSGITLLLLGAGSSSRIKPLGDKNLFVFLEKTLLEHKVEQVKKISNIEKVLVVANKNNYKKFSELSRGQFEVVIQKGEGQAGAVLTGLERSEGGPVLVMNVDDFFDDLLIDDLNKRLNEFLDDNKGFFVAVKVNEYFPGAYLHLNPNGFVDDLIEKPGSENMPSNYFKFVLDFFPDSNALKTQLINSQSIKDDLYEVATSNLMRSGTIFEMIEYSGQWVSIKYPWHILTTANYFLNKIDNQSISPGAFVSPNAYVNGNVIIEEGVKVYDGAVINGPVFIGKNSIIGNNALVRGSMIGKNCVIGFASEVARSYLSDNVWLHKNYIGDSVVSKNVSFGSGAITANLRLDEGNIPVKIKDQRIDSGTNKLGSIIGSDVRIGVGALIMPGVKIGSNSVVGPGVVLGEDIDDGTFVSVKQDLKFAINKLDIKKIARNG